MPPPETLQRIILALLALALVVQVLWLVIGR